MPVHLPAEVASGGLVDCARNRGEIGRHMMLKTVFADVMQKMLQARDFDDSGAAERIQRIVRKNTLPRVAADDARSVVRREARKAHRTRFHAAHASSDC